MRPLWRLPRRLTPEGARTPVAVVPLRLAIRPALHVAAARFIAAAPEADTVEVAFVPSGPGPWTVEATLHYQAFTPRFLDTLTAVDTPETRALAVMLDGRPVRVEPLATVTAVVVE